MHGLHEAGGITFRTQIDDELAAFARLVELHAEFGRAITAHEIDARQLTRDAVIGAVGHFEMRDLRVHRPQTLLHLGSEGFEEVIGFKLIARRQAHRGIQPAKQSFTFGIDFVIDEHGAFLCLLIGHELREEVHETLARARRSTDDLGSRKLASQRSHEFFTFRIGDEITFADDDDVRLFELLFENVHDFAREAAASIQPEDTARAHWIHEHRQRRDGEGISIHTPQRIRHSGNEIGATPHGLRDEDIGSFALGKPARSIHERTKAAAKAPARDLLRGKALSAQQLRIHETTRLIIRDEPDLQSLIAEVMRELANSRGFTSAEEAADHDVTCFGGGHGGNVCGVGCEKAQAPLSYHQTYESPGLLRRDSRATTTEQHHTNAKHAESHAAGLWNDDGDGAECIEAAHIEARASWKVQAGGVEVKGAAHAGEAAPVEELEGIAIGPGGEVVRIAEAEESAGLDVESAEEPQLVGGGGVGGVVAEASAAEKIEPQGAGASENGAAGAGGGEIEIRSGGETGITDDELAIDEDDVVGARVDEASARERTGGIDGDTTGAGGGTCGVGVRGDKRATVLDDGWADVAIVVVREAHGGVVDGERIRRHTASDATADDDVAAGVGQRSCAASLCAGEREHSSTRVRDCRASIPVHGDASRQCGRCAAGVLQSASRCGTDEDGCARHAKWLRGAVCGNGVYLKCASANAGGASVGIRGGDGQCASPGLRHRSISDPAGLDHRAQGHVVGTCGKGRGDSVFDFDLAGDVLSVARTPA